MDAEFNAPSRWPFVKRIAFRFFFTYFVLYIWPFPVYFIPYSYYVTQPLSEIFNRVVAKAGPVFLGQNYYHNPAMNGSGDTSHQYAQVFLLLIITSIITLIWSVLDRRRQIYSKLYGGLNIYVRYYLAATLLSYGFMKVFPVQFSTPPLSRLSQTYGESSPMGLLWTFMGYSAPYTIFTGVGETLAGTLLLFRRTRLLGALLSALIMVHVFVLNMSYDVPVKLLSFHLLVMSIFLIGPDFKRLVNLFVLNKTAPPQVPDLVITDIRLKWMAGLVKAGIIYVIFFSQLFFAIESRKSVDEVVASNSENETTGEFSVTHFLINGDTLPPISRDTRRWKAVLFNGNTMQIKSMDGFAINWHCAIRNGIHKVKMYSTDFSTYGEFDFEKEGDILVLKGILNQDSLHVVSRRISTNSVPLLARGFHWISESPFNR